MQMATKTATSKSLLCSSWVYLIYTPGPFLESHGNFSVPGTKLFLVNPCLKTERWIHPKLLGTSVDITTMWIKQLCNHKVWHFASAFRVRKLFGVFKKRAHRSRTVSRVVPQTKTELLLRQRYFAVVVFLSPNENISLLPVGAIFNFSRQT